MTRAAKWRCSLTIPIGKRPEGTYDFEPVRLEYYAGKLFPSQDIRGKDKTFDDLKPAYQISLLVNKTFFRDDAAAHYFEYYDPERSIPLGGRSRIITVELNKLEEVVKKSVEDLAKSHHRNANG
jgi:hypothetical protein